MTQRAHARWWHALGCAAALLCASGHALAEAWQHGSAPLPGLGGPLDLIDQQGRHFSLKALGTQPALVFFGFTRCSTACPYALLQARQVLNAFQARRAPNVIFVTLDPLSDDPATLARYLGAIDTRITGLTGSPTKVAQAAERYGVGTKGQGSQQEHSARWYLVTSDQTIQRVYDSQTTGLQIAQDLMRFQSTPDNFLKRGHP